MAQRHRRIMVGQRLSKLILSLLLSTVFVDEAVADPNRPTSSLPRAAAKPASTVATITANQSQIGATIPPNFVGFSVELQDVLADSIFTPGNTSLINLINIWLGPSGLLRIGGNSSDTSPAPALTQQIANDVSAFISNIGSGWQTIYGLDSVVKDTNTAMSHASFLLSSFPSANIAFQVGNEPEATFGTEQSWAPVFNSYFSALTATFPDLKFGGPDTILLSNVSWTNGTIPGASGVKYVTAHKYTLGCAPVSLTPAQVLADATVTSNPGVTLSEFGMICGGGQQGITDRLMAATYYLKLAQSAFAAGFNAILPHNVLTPFHWDDGTFRVAYYNQFVQQPDGGYAPAPMFYGMLLFQALEGLSSISTTTSNLDNLASVTAVLGSNGQAWILVVNGDTAQGITVEPQQTSSWSTAIVYLLSGTSCTDPSPVLNGSPIGEGGVWASSATILTNGETVFIPACGAALIEIAS
jgi:hypothetical protein